MKEICPQWLPPLRTAVKITGGRSDKVASLQSLRDSAWHHARKLPELGRTAMASATEVLETTAERRWSGGVPTHQICPAMVAGFDRQTLQGTLDEVPL
jgi:hypothetical protein